MPASPKPSTPQRQGVLFRGASLALAATLAVSTAAPAAAASLTAPANINIASVSVSGKPVITGKPDVGTTLYLDTGKWSAGAEIAIQWYRDDSRVSGATGFVYRTSRADIGARVHAVVTGKDGSSSKSVTSAKTDKIGWPKLISRALPKLSGTTMDGYKLTATTGSWDKPGVSVKYQWYRNGYPLSGSTGKTYTLVKSDVGSNIKVRVTASREMSTPAWAESIETAKIRAKAVISRGAPVVGGSTQVGYTLTARSAGWAPSGTKESYQWLRDGKSTSGAKSRTYKLTSADLGKRISVKVTGSSNGWASVTTSSKETAKVRAAEVVNRGKPTISGSRMHGYTLTASNGTWSPASVNVKYQWLRNGKAIEGATSKRYAPSKADVGRNLSVKVTASIKGHTGASATSAGTSKIMSKAVRASAAPKISGSAMSGRTLKATAPTWTPANASTRYQWLRDGKDISGATGTTYQLTKTDVGQAISVKATGSLGGWASATSTSGKTALVKAGTLASKSLPRVTGTLRTFQTLHVSQGSWSESIDSASYQWKRSGKNIAGATKPTYKLTAADAGHSMTVTVRAGKKHWNSASATTTPSAKVVLSPIANNSRPEIGGIHVHGTTLYARPGSWNPTNVKYQYQWLRNGEPVAGQNGLVYRTSDADLGSKISLRTTVSQAGYQSRSVTSAETPIINFPPMVSTSAPKLSGSSYAGRSLSTTRGRWDVPASSTSVQWYRDGKAIKGATGTRYTTKLSDAGHSISSKIKATGPRRVPASAVSNTVKITEARVLSSSAPVLSGRAMAGFTLTTSNGVFSPANANVSLQWLRDGSPIAGENGKTYLLRSADIGKRISVTSTARVTGWITATSTSNQTGHIAEKSVLNRGAPKLSGRVMEGYTLTTTNGAWDPAQVSVSYQWLRNGETIAGATGKSHTLTNADIGHRISVTVVAAAQGWASEAATSAATGKVSEAKVINKAAPRVTGSTHKGQLLTATEGSWSPKPSKVTYQWFRGGEMITGANSATYRTGNSDVGHKVSARVTAHAPGHATGVKTSNGLGNIVHGVLTNNQLPSVSGDKEVFATLTANEGTWSQSPDSYTYQWYRNGAAISGKTSKTYKASQIDKGKQLSVRVTARKTDWASGAATSNKTGALAGANLVNSRKPSVDGTMKAGYRIWANPGAWTPSNANMRYQWFVDGAKVDGATDMTFGLFKEHVGSRISVQVTATMYGYEQKVMLSPASASVGR